METHLKNKYTIAYRQKLREAQLNGYIDKIKENKKLCPKCNKILNLENFNKSSKRTNKYQLWCKKCGLEEKKKAYHSYRKNAVKLSSKKAQLKKDYGITLEQYEDMKKSQNGRCAICGRIPFKKNNQFGAITLVVDHCHKTKTTRGLLCTECNFGISKFEDNIEYLKNAISYLERFNVLLKKIEGRRK